MNRLFRSVYFNQRNGPTLHARLYGAGTPTFLLIHGGADGAFVWDELATALANRYTAICVDLRGHGDSGWDTAGRYDRDSHISDLKYVIEESKLQSFVLIGHSLGGQLSIHLRSLYPQQVLACVLVDFAPQLTPEGTQQAAELFKESSRRYPSVESYVDWLKETRPLTRGSILERVAEQSLRHAPDGFRLKVDPAIADSFDEIQPLETDLLWAKLRVQACPTLVVRGGASAVVSRAAANRVVEVLPRGMLTTVGGAGHSLMLDNPAGFGRAVLDFAENGFGVQSRRRQLGRLT